MELIQINKEMYLATQRLDRASKEIFKLAKEKAESERIYRMTLGQEILKLRSEGVQATLIPDIARSNVADLKFDRDVAAEMYKSALASLEAIKTQCSVYQTIAKYQSEV